MFDYPVRALENMATSESATMSPLQIGGVGGDISGGEKVAQKKREAKNYRGFVAGVFSGVSKLTGRF